MNAATSMRIGEVKKDPKPTVSYMPWLVKCEHGIESFHTKRSAKTFAYEYKKLFLNQN